jgi:predicted  nucleic acid-binding Zn-ribbon protein
MLGGLTNCLECGKLFSDPMSRGLCPTCFGQKVFKKQKPEPVVPVEDEDINASTMGVSRPIHELRCDQYADKGRAHESTVRRGKSSFW